MKKKIREYLSLAIAKNPGRMVLQFILLANVVFFLLSAFIIYQLAPESLSGCTYWQTVFYTITMVLDAGCIQFIVSDATVTSGIVIVFCLFVVVIGMIIFTGAVIGYLTNYISTFIENTNEGRNSLNISGHTIILNWNSRASEIINDLYFSERREKVIVLVRDNRKQIEKEIESRLEDTAARERQELVDNLMDMGMSRTKATAKAHRMVRKDRMSILVREGETYSAKDLQDISIEKAKAVIILGSDFANSACRYAYLDQLEKYEQGNTDVIKTLIQVAELTGAENSADDQHIVVEVEDDWTLSIVQKIIDHKENAGKCNIIPVAVNRVLGQILSQFSIMPELNTVYRTLFSNKGAAFCCRREERPEDENGYFARYLNNHSDAIPLGFLSTKEGSYCYYVAENDGAVSLEDPAAQSAVPIRLADFRMRKKNVIILGHNSKSHYIMEGFNSFRSEWNEKNEKGEIVREVMNIMVIDDADSLKKQDYYRQYPQVTAYREAGIYDHDSIIEAIDSFTGNNDEDTSILILSDDHASTDDLDGNALIYLIYVEEIISQKLQRDRNFDVNSIDVIVEILNPKNSDVARSYSVDNVVISNRYVSKMMTQISEKKALFEFYNDILTYDTEEELQAAAENMEAQETDAGSASAADAVLANDASSAADAAGTATCVADAIRRRSGYESKEVYVKPVVDFFETIPPRCTAQELIRGVFEAGAEDNKSMIIGMVDAGSNVRLFDGSLGAMQVELTERDKVVMYTNH